MMHHVQHFHIREVRAIGFSHIHGFADHLFGKAPCVLIFNHIGNGRFSDGRERVDGQVDEQFAPDDALDVIGNSRLEARFAQQVGDRLKMDVFFQIAADGGHTVAAVPDLAAAQIHRVVLAGADDDVLGFDVLRNLAVVACAVLQGHHQGVFAEQLFVFFEGSFRCGWI